MTRVICYNITVHYCRMYTARSCLMQEFLLDQQLRSMHINASVNASSLTFFQGYFSTKRNYKFKQMVEENELSSSTRPGRPFPWSRIYTPATSNYNSTLSNGSTVAVPLGGYQYVPGKHILLKPMTQRMVNDTCICSTRYNKNKDL